MIGIIKNLFFFIVLSPVGIENFSYWPWNNKPTSKAADKIIYYVSQKIKVFWKALSSVSSLTLKIGL